MYRSRDQFYLKQPSRILAKASNYSKRIDLFYELPKATSKSMIVRETASNFRDDIDYAIKNSSFQLELYRKKQRQDHKSRTNFSQKIRSAAEKVEKNQRELSKKKEKQAENYNSHLVKTYRRYQDEERRHRSNEQQESGKLRKQLQEFYSKEEERKKIAELKQIQVGTQYQKALDRLNKIHLKNQQFSQKAELELDQELRKNSHSGELLKAKRRALSALNDQKTKKFNKSLSIFDDREIQFIQTYGKNEDGSLKAFKHKEQVQEKNSKRLAEFFQKRVEKWSHLKKRVEEIKAEVPQKCLSILDKTSRSAFNRTVSTFRNSSIQWSNIVRKNKSLIRERDERLKDNIMDFHLDLRLKKSSTFKITQKMDSFKHHARRLANSFL